jgi:Carboxypeptidase regulatory-like domain
MITRKILTALILLCSPALAAAQSTAGRISGVVADRAGGVILGARVIATSDETGQQYTAVTGEQGQYLLYPLPSGSYSITVRKDGFRVLRIERLKVSVADHLTRNFALDVGEQIIAQVTITAGAESEVQQAPVVQSTIIREQITNLPLNDRDYNQLILLAAGAVENIGSGNGRDFGAVAVNGNRAFSNDYLLDGAPNNDLYQGRSALPVSVDVIGEFKVTSNVAPAEYGQAGTQVSVVTRGGSNQFRGSLFEFYRGALLEARDPFNPGKPAPFRRHQFGGSLGGPVLLPGYSGRNRTFFFANYEGARERQEAPRVATVPLDEFWRGDFSSLLARNIQLRDPLLPGRPAIPGNRLDTYLNGSRVNQTAVKLRPFWGSPTQSGLANNAVRFGKNVNDLDQFTIRLDHSLTGSQSLSLRHSSSFNDASTPSLLANGSGLLTPINNHNATLTHTWTLTPGAVNELRFGYANYDSLTTYNDGGLPTVSSLGLKGFELADLGVPPMPRITFTGGDAFTQLNYGGNANFGMAALTKISNTYTLSETLTHTRGSHVLKAGFEGRRVAFNALQQTNARGSISFSPSANSTNTTGYPFADFLIGLPSSTQEVAIKQPILLTQTEIASYAQDDWRVTSRLLPSFGLRHEAFFNPTEERDRLAIFDPETGAIVVATGGGALPVREYLPSVVRKLADAQGNFRFPLLKDTDAGLEEGRLLKTLGRNFGPRAGFAWQIDGAGRTVLRGGYGIFYTRYPRQYLLQTIAINPPFAGTFSYSQAIQNGQPALSLDAPYPAAGGATGFSPAGFQRSFKLPSNQQWNLTLEREIGLGTIFSLGYVGNKGTHLFRSTNVNAPTLNPETGQITRRFSANYGTSAIPVRQSDGSSTYHAMLLEARRRVGSNLFFQGNWTWAKGIDNTGETVQAALLDNEDLGRDRANSDYTRRHMVKVNASYRLPFGRGQAFFGSVPAWIETALGGWRVSGIWQYATGRYFTPTFAASGGLSNSRPDVVPGVSGNLPRGARTPQRWFNPAAFAIVPATDPSTGLPRFGKAGRNILIGPGLNVVDATLAKSWQVYGDNTRLAFRLEAFNLFNHANYDLPDRNISNTNTVGTINSVVRPARQVQFAFRLDF